MSEGYDFRYTPAYVDCLNDYSRRSDVLADLHLALAQLAVQPFANPRLQTHSVKRAQGNTFTSYVGNQGHRIIWRLVGRVIVLLLFGEHDAVYRRAERIRLEIDDIRNVLRVIDEDPSSGEPTPYAERRMVEGSLFMAWNDRELGTFGFREHEVGILRGLDDEDSLIALEHRMRPDAWTTAMNLVAYGHPDGQASAAAARIEVEAEMVAAPRTQAVPDRDPRLEQALLDERTRAEFVPIAAHELADVLARPIEDWMIYLDPSQQSLVERSFGGPARIRGAAGTGKTVVGLHRARRLAHIDGVERVLFTTFVRNLSRVYEHLFARLAPGVSTVEFANVHSWAMGILNRNGVQLNLKSTTVSYCWKSACDSVLTTGNPLRKAKLTRSYLKEEVDWLIKGRGLTSLEDYLALRRSGRGTPLAARLREAVWELYEAYTAQLSRLRAHDFNDILLQALDVVRSRGIDSPYDAIIVDEAQDLTEVAIRLLHSAAGTDRTDGLLLIGDGQQSVYPGGFSLSSLGIDVRGRSAVLTRNYRNTKQILGTATAVMSGEPFDDGGDDLEVRGQASGILREGAPPTFQRFATKEDHDLGLCAAIDEAIGHGTGPGDLAVLVPTNALVSAYIDCIRQLGLPAQYLEDYDGNPSPEVKVGTFQRAKGLEFKRVFLPRLDSDGIGERRLRSLDDETRTERLALIRRQLFVAMTRARDCLWLGWVGEPSSLLTLDGAQPRSA